MEFFINVNHWVMDVKSEKVRYVINTCKTKTFSLVVVILLARGMYIKQGRVLTFIDMQLELTTIIVVG